MRDKNFASALDLGAEYTSAKSSDPEGWRYRAYVFEASGANLEAEKAMSVAIELAPREPGYYWLRGMYRLLNNADDIARQDFTMTLSLSEEAGSAYYREMAFLLRAEAFRRLGQKEMALADCQHVGDEAFIWLNRTISRREILANISNDA